MDLIFIEGIAVTIAALIVFFGTIWLLMSVVMGGRLAYFVTASVALGFIFIMTLVWSYGTPLGPVGVMPEWHGVDIAESATEIKDLGPAAEYPEEPWEVPDKDDPADTTKAAELESAAVDYLEKQIEEDAGGDFVQANDATVTSDTARLLTQGDVEYGALTLEAAAAAITKFNEADDDQLDTITPKDATAVVVMRYDPGNPLGKARKIAAGTFLVFALHLFGLSRAERKTKKETNNGEGS